MIISRTPFRISFFGGGTDYPEWYLEEGGAVLSTTIDKYCFISCRYLPPFFGIKHRVVWSHIEAVSTIAEILHPAVREGMHFLGFDDTVGLEIHHQGDLPARAGMGSSSAFAVGLIKALTALRGRLIGKQELAHKAIELEQQVLAENVGSQDQVAVAFGGFNVIHFKPCGDIQVEPVTIPAMRIRELESHLMLFYLGTSRHSSKFASDVIANLTAKRKQLLQMRNMVDQATDILAAANGLEPFGELLHEAWMVKRELSKDVSNSTVDRVYETALANGSLGGKLLGAGGTGFMLFFVPPEKREAVRLSLSPFIHVPFRFEREGSSLIHYGTNSSESSPAGKTGGFEREMSAQDKLHELAASASF